MLLCMLGLLWTNMVGQCGSSEGGESCMNEGCQVNNRVAQLCSQILLRRPCFGDHGWWQMQLHGSVAKEFGWNMWWLPAQGSREIGMLISRSRHRPGRIDPNFLHSTKIFGDSEICVRLLPIAVDLLMNAYSQLGMKIQFLGLCLLSWSLLRTTRCSCSMNMYAPPHDGELRERGSSHHLG